MSRSERLLGEFADAWSAGERPRVDDYLERAPEAEGAALAADLQAFLAYAPAPPLSDAERAEILREPLARALVEMGPSGGGWPELLPLLRRRARLRRDRLVAALAARLGVDGAEEQVAGYYHAMEAGTLAPEGVSGRVLNALAELLGVGREELERAAALASGPVGTERAFARTASDLNFALGSADALADPGPPELDEVDALFLGGR